MSLLIVVKRNKYAASHITALCEWRIAHSQSLLSAIHNKLLNFFSVREPENDASLGLTPPSVIIS